MQRKPGGPVVGIWLLLLNKFGHVGIRRVGEWAFHLLPRLGSRVRIPSPAPDFLNEIRVLKRSLGAVFCFPAHRVGAGEAPGKQPASCCGIRPAAFGTGDTVISRRSARPAGSVGGMSQPSGRTALSAPDPPGTVIPMRLGCVTITAQCSLTPCALAEPAEASRAAARNHGPRRSRPRPRPARRPRP